jgi:hypothetical protein
MEEFISKAFIDLTNYDVEKTINDIFKAAFTTGASESIKKEGADILRIAGGNGSNVEPFFDTITEMLSISSPNPTDEQKTQIVEKWNELFDRGLTCGTSLPSVMNMLNNSELMSDPEHTEFFQAAEKIFFVGEEIKQNPSFAHKYFHDPESPVFMARLLVLWTRLARKESEKKVSSKLMKCLTKLKINNF